MLMQVHGRMSRAGVGVSDPSPALATTDLLCGVRHAMTASHPTVPGVRFKSIAGCVGYCIGDDGSPWSANDRKGRLTCDWRKIVLRRRRDGYSGVQLTDDMGKRRYRPVHQLVLEAFVGPRPVGMEACHNDGNPANNRLDNLRWDTHAANTEDSRRQGRLAYNRGERNGRAKLTEADVVEIKRLRGLGMTFGAIASRFGLGYSTVSHAVRGYSWRHLR